MRRRGPIWWLVIAGCAVAAIVVMAVSATEQDPERPPPDDAEIEERWEIEVRADEIRWEGSAVDDARLERELAELATQVLRTPGCESHTPEDFVAFGSDSPIGPQPCEVLVSVLVEAEAPFAALERALHALAQHPQLAAELHVFQAATAVGTGTPIEDAHRHRYIADSYELLLRSDGVFVAEPIWRAHTACEPLAIGREMQGIDHEALRSCLHVAFDMGPSPPARWRSGLAVAPDVPSAAVVDVLTQMRAAFTAVTAGRGELFVRLGLEEDALLFRDDLFADEPE